MCRCRKSLSPCEFELRERIRSAGDALPSWSWRIEELRALAALLESFVIARTADVVDQLADVIRLPVAPLG